MLDTRPEYGPIGVPVGKPLGDSETLNLRFKGAGQPLPAAAVAAVINVTIDDDATKKSFMTVWPEGEPRPVSSVTTRSLASSAPTRRSPSSVRTAGSTSTTTRAR